jgi:predicted MFS family arabinose efflux permease
MTEIVIQTRSSWPAVLSVAVGTFVMVTTEFLPIGLLSNIAEEFGIPSGQAGILVTTPGIAAAIAAPVCTIAAGKVDRRLLLIGFTFLVLLSNIIVASATSFEVALVGRALLGVSVGGFWTFAAAVGRKLVLVEDGNRATSIIMAGISVGTVIGVPLGSALGSMMGWRLAFIVVAGLCLAAFLAQSAFLPKISIVTAQTVKTLVGAARSRKLAVVFIAAGLAACGHFAAYTYLEPHLVANVGANPATLGWLLAIYGAAGIVGTFIGEILSRRTPPAGFALVVVTMAASISMAVISAGSLPLETFAIAFWGLAFGAVPVCVQLWAYAADPDRFEASSALTVTVFQIAVAAGSSGGGLLADAYGLPTAFTTGAALSLLSVLPSAASIFRSIKHNSKEI